jgi:hypothetical protein
MSEVLQKEKQMTNEEIVALLRKYGTKRYPKTGVARVVDSAPGTTMKQFIESLTYGNQRQDRTDAA